MSEWDSRGLNAVLLSFFPEIEVHKAFVGEPIRKFVCGSELREKQAHEEDEAGKDGTGSCSERKDGGDVRLIDQWLAEPDEGPEDILEKEGLLAQLTKAVVERALGSELTHHLGYGPGGAPDSEGGNCRQGLFVWRPSGWEQG